MLLRFLNKPRYSNNVLQNSRPFKAVATPKQTLKVEKSWELGSHKPTPMYSTQLCVGTIYFKLQPARCLTLLATRFT